MAEVVKRRQRPFEWARTWRQQMGTDPMLNKTKIAAREGISRARVTQIMNLLELPAEIQSDLLCPPVIPGSGSRRSGADSRCGTCAAAAASRDPRLPDQDRMPKE